MTRIFTAAAKLDRKALTEFANLTADEPAVRPDGLCSVCLGPRRPERSARYAHGCAEIDSFCSTECARVFHRNPIPASAAGHLGYIKQSMTG